MATDFKFNTVKRRKVHEDVAEQIEEQILAGALAEGSILPSERNLMQAFNVGRPAIREALLLLQRNGFIEVLSNGRPVVTRPTPQLVVDQLTSSARYLLSSKQGQREFQDARRLFEAAIARVAAEVATPDDIEKLDKALAENHDAIGDVALFEQTDVAFHLVIAEICKNPVYTALHTAIAEWLSMQRKVSLRIKGVEESAYASHKAIFEAIAAGKPNKAWRAMDTHLKDIIEKFEQGSRHEE